MCAHGGVTGITNETWRRPWLTKLLVRYLKSEAPGVPFTSIMLSWNNKADLHIDIKNPKGTKSILSGLTKFKGGQLWCEESCGNHGLPRDVDPSGELRGNRRQVSRTSCVFDGRKKHCTMPFTGERIVASGYIPMGIKFAKKWAERLLKKLGFVIPSRRFLNLAKGAPTMP